ncbi:hypothetical protein WSM22_05660 [Cytophagales bacterium WSM2-2]|nr:hypothetical protein WSM22_05660 [Cytophagales bacterium WSM2-2]
MPSPLPYKDFTLKAKINSSETEKILHALNAIYVGLDRQIDYYFETSRGKLKWRDGTIEKLITHYERVTDSGIERTTVFRYDLNPTQEQIDELLLNHKKIGTTQKERKIYIIRNIKIHIDKLPNQEEFIEIEAIDRGNKFTIDELKAQCLELKSRLGIQDIDLIPTGYLKTDK